MLKELDQQTMEETTGGTFCLIGGVFTGLLGIIGNLCQPPAKPTCPVPAPAPAPTCPPPAPAPSPCPPKPHC